MAKFIPGRTLEFATGCTNGEIKLWDVRQTGSTLSINSGMVPIMKSIHLHEHAPLIAWYLIP